MTEQSPPSTLALLAFSDDNTMAYCQGDWTVKGLDGVDRVLASKVLPAAEALTIDGRQLTDMDTAGALVLQRWVAQLKREGKEILLSGFADMQMRLLDLVANEVEEVDKPVAKRQRPNWLHRFGKAFVHKLHRADGYLLLTGETTIRIFRALGHPKRLQPRSIIRTIELTGLQALPIVALLNFLIGIVLAYQLGTQLRDYGADVFVIDFSGIAILREFGPLITAIIVAGRTASSFTAQIGLMKVNEEVDALLTMGISPVERLVVPKVLGLMIAMPLLTFWADFFGVLGSMVMAKGMFQITYVDFIQRFQVEVAVSNYFMGLSKAPVFALLIASVGCYHGFRVESSAESVGIRTTASVVQSIFLIILADAAFSILFTWSGW